MQIFIMRHGEAENTVVEDSLRALTKEGVNETKKMGVWLAKQDLSTINIFVSPFIRAQQTCDNIMLALNNVKFDKKIQQETIELITPSGNAKQMHNFMDGFFDDMNSQINSDAEDSQAVLLISHMPFVSFLVGELTDSLYMPIFSTGAIIVIDYDIEKMQGKIIEMVSPEKLSNQCELLVKGV